MHGFSPIKAPSCIGQDTRCVLQTLFIPRIVEVLAYPRVENFSDNTKTNNVQMCIGKYMLLQSKKCAINTKDLMPVRLC